MASSGKRQTEMMVNVLGSMSRGRVLYIESEKEFVDVILSLLALPVGSLLHLLRKTSESGNVWDVRDSQFLPSLVNVYATVCDIDNLAFQTSKADLTEPRLPVLGNNKLLIGFEKGSKEPQEQESPWYRCRSGNSCPYISKAKSFVCPSHSSSGERVVCSVIEGNQWYHCNYGSGTLCSNISRNQSFNCPQHSTNYAKPACKVVEGEPDVTWTSGAGYVKENVAFMITDDLQIFKSSTIRSIQLLNEMKITNMADLTGVRVSVGQEEILKLIRLAVTCQQEVLTKVFGKKFSEHMREQEKQKK